MASGLLIKQKQLLAGDGITIEHAQTSSTISLSNSTLNAAVRIYDATIDSDTGVVTITDGTPVENIRIGDEIVTADGVYQKTKDSITTGEPANGTRIEVSGITSPAEADGVYILTETEHVWKHESADYWILLWDNASWMISAVENPASPAQALFYTYAEPSVPVPWEVTSWISMSEAVTGSPVVENASTEQTITNTIDLFEYASTSVASADIVQSVNGNKPDASGNVTIDVTQSGLESVSTGTGLTGDGTAGDPITLDLNNYVAESDIKLTASGPHSVKLFKGLYGITISDDGIVLESTNTSVALDIGITYNNNPINTAGGFAIVGSNGKLPSTIYDAGSKIKKIIVQRPQSDDSLYPILIASQTSDFAATQSIDPYSTSSDRAKIEVFDGDQWDAFPSNGGLGTPFDGMEVSFDVSDITYTEPYYVKYAWKTSEGTVSNYKGGIFPSSLIIPTIQTGQSSSASNRHSFTSSDLSTNVLTITTTGNVTGVIDDSGKAWNLDDEEVTYTDSGVSVDLTGVFARKGVASPTGTWKLMLYGA